MEYFDQSQDDGGGINSGGKPNGSSGNAKKLGLIIGGVIGGSAVLLSAISMPFITPAFRKICLPYVPATTAQVNNIFKALRGRSGSLIDLGSGDGRIVFEAARNGFVARGIELNPWLVIYSKLKAIYDSSPASFAYKDIWKTDLRYYDNIVVFGVESMMQELESKCKNELRPNSVIIACRFPFPELIPEQVVGDGIDKVWLYSKLYQSANFDSR